MKKLLQFLAVVLFFSACQKETTVNELNTSTALETPAPPPSNQGQNSKAVVIKFEGVPYGTLFPVPDKEITLVINIDFKDVCSGNFGVPTLVDLHRVIKNEEGFPRIHEVFSGKDVYLEIWDFADMGFGGDCQPYDNAGDPIYSGLVTLQGTDNDVYPFDNDHNVNSFGFVAHGDDISVVFRGAWDGLNEDTWAVRVCKIKYN